MPAKEITLRCTPCGYENEPQRVYCHNCGTKLDRRLLPPEMTDAPDNSKVERHIRRITDPRRGILKRRIINVGKSLFVGAIIGFLITIFRPPSSEPAPQDDNGLAAAPFIYDDVQGALGQAAPKRLVYTEAQANGYLQGAYRARDITSYVPTLRYERTYVAFDEGFVDVTAHLSLVTWPIHFGGQYIIQIKGEQIQSRCIAGRMGRLTIPGPVMQLLNYGMDPLWTLLERDRKSIARLQSVTFRKGVVELQTKGQ